MPEKYTIGLDYGTLSGRAVLVRISDGAEMGNAVMDYPHGVMDSVLSATGESLPPDFALQDPQDYIDVLKYTVPTVLSESGISPADVIGIGVDFTTCTVLPVYTDGTPLCFDGKFRKNKHAYVKLWKHHAAQPYADRLNRTAAERGEEWLSEYGGKISSEWLFPKIWEILDKAPEVYAAAGGFMEAGDFITMYLTGVRTKSYVFSASKAIYNAEKGYPSPDFFAALDKRLCNVVAEKLNAPMVFTGEKAGNVCRRAALELGLSENTAVSCPLPDAHVATAALNMKTSGDMCAIMGTSSCYMLIGDGYASVPGICGTHRDSLTPGFWGYEAGLCCVGDHFAWVADRLAPAKYRDEAEKQGISMLKYMIEKASRKKPGETGLLALDWWNGNRSILVDSALSGLIVGLSLQTEAEDILRALIEATAFGTRVILENYREHGVEVKRFIAAGGIARKDPFTMQLYADVLGIDIQIAGSTQIPALSSAIYAAAAAGLDLGECMDSMSRISDVVYHPDAVASAVYDKLYAEYRSLYDLFGRGGSDVMKRLREIKGDNT